MPHANPRDPWRSREARHRSPLATPEPCERVRSSPYPTIGDRADVGAAPLLSDVPISYVVWEVGAMRTVILSSIAAVAIAVSGTATSAAATAGTSPLIVAMRDPG